jgi:hypothetical protein
MRGNPISEFIPENLYFDLLKKGFLNERAIRDYYLKKKYYTLRSRYTPQDIFSLLQEEFPYICKDTIRKIIYTRGEIDRFLTPELSTDTEYHHNFFEKKVV